MKPRHVLIAFAFTLAIVGIGRLIQAKPWRRFR